MTNSYILGCKSKVITLKKDFPSRFVVVMDVSGSMEAVGNSEHIPRFRQELKKRRILMMLGSRLFEGNDE